jgi:hypothetical protein
MRILSRVFQRCTFAVLTFLWEYYSHGVLSKNGGLNHEAVLEYLMKSIRIKTIPIEKREDY